MKRPALITLLVPAAAALLVAGCGGSSKKSTAPPAPAATTPAATTPAATTPAAPSGGASLSVTADPSGQLTFTEKTLSAKAGAVKVTFTNASPVPHNVQFELNGTTVGGTQTISGGKTTATVTLKAGTYKYFCSVDGHRAGGMEGTLTVS